MKPRNIFVPLALKRKAGAHGKTEKAERRNSKMKLQRMIKNSDSGIARTMQKIFLAMPLWYIHDTLIAQGSYV